MKQQNLKVKLLVMLTVLCHLAGYSQNGNITAKLKAYNTIHPAEKAYLHFDKPYYAAGDTIYFKAYVTLGEKHELSTLSGILHVDLINTKNKIDQSLKLRVHDGVAWGDFTLADSLPGGSYRVRAYTQWMRNDGDAGFFDQAIPVGSAANNRMAGSGSYRVNGLNGKPDIQFFPEGGGLVNGISSKIAFKAIGANGLGINAKGSVTDNTGNVILKFETAHLGMGSFELKPEAGRTYQAKLTYDNGMQDAAGLPVASAKGIVLKINNEAADKAAIQLVANDEYFAENRDKDVNLLVYTSGFVNAVTIKLDSAMINLAILKKRLRSGITKVSLFSAGGEPLSERLFFVQNPDQLKLSLNTDKAQYAKRGAVQLNISVADRSDAGVTGHFSVAVIDENKVQTDENGENTILTNLLLTSDLKGYIEQPNYYFISPTPKTSADLDLVMLTHGYRRFEWKKLMNDEYPPIVYQPENSLEITGMAKNGFGRPLIGGTVSLITPKGGPFISENTDEKGNFRFNNLLFTDSTRFILQAVNSRGVNSTIIYNKEALKPTVSLIPYVADNKLNQPAQTYLDNAAQQHEQAVKDGTAKEIMLQEVRIKQNKSNIIHDDYRSTSLSGPGFADQVVRRSEFRTGGQFTDVFNGVLRDILFTAIKGQTTAYLTSNLQMASSKIQATPMYVLIDGTPMPNTMSINDINVNTIETIEVLRSANTSIYGVNGAGGVLVITTRHGGQNPNEIAAVGILPITAIGFYKAREFYAPKYDHQADNLNRADLRSTIYWKPEFVTDKDGNVVLNYYNADSPGNYRVVVEGIDENGNIGRQVYRYKVGE